MNPAVASLYQAVALDQEIKPLIIGERTNANGSKRFRECLLADDFQGCLAIGLEQEQAGAQVLDVCAAYAGRDETADMTELVRRFASSLKLPLVIDSTTPATVEACLRVYPGRAIVNSINLEDGGANLRTICALARKYGAAVIALTINQDGMAMRTDEKVDTARAIYRMAVDTCGLRPADLIFDPLTFTVGAGDKTLRDAAVQTLDAIRQIKAELPGVRTVLGVSNISFGLAPASRKVLNSLFLHEAVGAGLDAAIIDAAKILPLNRIEPPEREVCMNLLYDRGDGNPLETFINHFSEADDEPESEGEDTRLPQRVLFDRVVDGAGEGLEDQLSILLQRITPLGIINEILVPAMRHVGELFGAGEMLLPFVLKSAEVMKRAVTFLEPLLERAEDASTTRILLATVQGDVHDIGKNLVEIILANNGYEVHNLGIKVPAETIIAEAKARNVDVIGLSGLLVKSAIVMQESLAQYEAAGLQVPILLGGAALTRRFVAESCAPRYNAPVVYCNDAFIGLQAMRAYEAGTLTSTVVDTETTTVRRKPGARQVDLDTPVAVPEPPFLGARHVTDIAPETLYQYINEQALFRGRWGYRRGNMSAEDYARLVDTEVAPTYARMCREAGEQGWLQPRVAYGYFPCHSEGDTLFVHDAKQAVTFAFPRQQEPPQLCIADFFRAGKQADIVGLFVVTVGERISEMTRELYEKNAYHEYLLLHGFSVEATDALAEYWHEVMRNQLGIGAMRPAKRTGYAVQEYQGSRYGFGYPACPDLGAHRQVFELLDPGKIGVTLTESFEMVPEQSTSALVAHHPQAKYFAV